MRNPKEQKEVKKRIKIDCPLVLVVSPPCTAFSIANQGEVDPQTLAGAVEMVRFSMEICDLQHRAGRHFVFEQPQSSRAWNLDEVVRLGYQERGRKGHLPPVHVRPSGTGPIGSGTGL